MCATSRPRVRPVVHARAARGRARSGARRPAPYRARPRRARRRRLSEGPWWQRSTLFAQPRSRVRPLHALTAGAARLRCVVAGCGQAAAAPRGRPGCARGRAALCTYLQHNLTGLDGDVLGRHACSVAVRVRRRSGGAITGGGWTACGPAEAGSGGLAGPSRAFPVAVVHVAVCVCPPDVPSVHACGVWWSKALAKTVWDHHVHIKCHLLRILGDIN